MPQHYMAHAAVCANKHAPYDTPHYAGGPAKRTYVFEGCRPFQLAWQVGAVFARGKPPVGLAATNDDRYGAAAWCMVPACPCTCIAHNISLTPTALQVAARTTLAFYRLPSGGYVSVAGGSALFVACCCRWPSRLPCCRSVPYHVAPVKLFSLCLPRVCIAAVTVSSQLPRCIPPPPPHVQLVDPHAVESHFSEA